MSVTSGVKLCLNLSPNEQHIKYQVLIHKDTSAHRDPQVLNAVHKLRLQTNTGEYEPFPGPRVLRLKQIHPEIHPDLSVCVRYVNHQADLDVLGTGKQRTP